MIKPLSIAAASLLLPCLVAQEPATASDQGAQELARARAIHEKVITLDTHKDISPLLASKPNTEDPQELLEFRERFDPTYRGSQQVDFPKMREGGLDCAFFIVYVGQGRLDPAGYKRALDQANLKFDAIHRMADRFPEHVGLALTPDDVERIAKEGRLVACIGIENGYPMGEDPSRVEEFHRRGARYMSITHNRHSQLGDSHTPDEPLHGGLSDLGRRAIEEMNRVGIMVDVSHSAKKTMLETVAHSKAPVIASHSGVAAVHEHGRNLDDEQLLALKENDGVIQVVALGAFVKDYTERNAAIRALREELGLPSRWGRRQGDGPELSEEELERRLRTFQEGVKAIDAEHPPATVSDFVDHIDHAVRLIGIDHVGISSDFDGGGGIEGWNDASETFNVTLELVRRGYTEKEIGKLWSGNLLRVWRAVEKVAATLHDGR